MRVFKPDLHPMKTMARLAALIFLMLAASVFAQKVLVLTDDTLADALSANEKIMVEFYGASAVPSQAQCLRANSLVTACIRLNGLCGNTEARWRACIFYSPFGFSVAQRASIAQRRGAAIARH